MLENMPIGIRKGEIVIDGKQTYRFTDTFTHRGARDYVVGSDPGLYAQVTCHPAGYLNRGKLEYFHGMNLAVSLAAIGWQPFPGMKSDACAYPFEYAFDDNDSLINAFLQNRIARMAQETGSKNVQILEIGGQEGKWAKEFANNMKMHRDLSCMFDIFDLDLSRRPFLQAPYDDSVTFVEGDAHSLKNIMQSVGVGSYDAILFNNVANVMYDPILVFQQAWDLLKKGGFMFIVRSRKSDNIPFLVDGSDEAVIDVLAFAQKHTIFQFFQESIDWSPEMQIKYLNRRLAKSRDEDYLDLILNNAKISDLWVLNSLPLVAMAQGEFKYDSGTDFASEEITRISRLLEMIPVAHNEYSFSAVLAGLGIKVEHFASTRRGVPIVLPKENDDNPFLRFRPYAIGHYKYHMGEYIFPQVFRMCDLDVV